MNGGADEQRIRLNGERMYGRMGVWKTQDVLRTTLYALRLSGGFSSVAGCNSIIGSDWGEDGADNIGR